MGSGLYIAAVVLSLIAAIVVAVMVAPEKKKGKLGNSFLEWLNDLFNFRSLFIEKILKFLYILATCSCLFIGLFTLFGSFGMRYGGGTVALTGLLLMTVGPIAVRITYELLMMAIILVNNVIQINNKMPVNNAAPVAPAAPEYRFCSKCGTRFDTTKDSCPNCGSHT